MSLLNSILPTVTSATLGNQAASQKVNATQQSQQAVQTAVNSGAVVVQLSSNKANRTASYGESRQTDAAFEKQEAKEKVDKKKDEAKKSTGASVNVSA